MGFRVRYLAHDMELPVGEFVIGRSADCQLSVDDPLVSRRHAVLRVTREGVIAADLGSRNGVLVNGAKIDGPRDLADGDKVLIGSQELTVYKVDEQKPRARMDDEYRRSTQTLGALNVGDFQATVEPTIAEDTVVPTKNVNSFRLLAGVADKALAMGRAEEAERILNALLLDIRIKAQQGKLPEPEILQQAARYAARLAGATTKGSWVDYVFDLYTYAKKPLPAPVVDELYTVVRKVRSLDLTKIRTYLAELRTLAATFGPTERFLMQRIEGLEVLSALK
jgi:predicted component of type VI protein secretion system